MSQCMQLVRLRNAKDRSVVKTTSNSYGVAVVKVDTYSARLFTCALAQLRGMFAIPHPDVLW